MDDYDINHSTLSSTPPPTGGDEIQNSTAKKRKSTKRPKPKRHERRKSQDNVVTKKKVVVEDNDFVDEEIVPRETAAEDGIPKKRSKKKKRTKEQKTNKKGEEEQPGAAPVARVEESRSIDSEAPQETKKKKKKSKSIVDIESNNNNNNNNDYYDDKDEDEDADGELVQLLASQAYHLPGNSWCEDYYQYMFNNHPVIGICCHHPAHPIKWCTRVAALIGTITFGLTLTSFFWIFFLWNPHWNQSLYSYTDQNGQEWIVLSTGMFLLWTVGGGLHAVCNLLLWHIAACSCCQPGGGCEKCACCPNLGKHMTKVLVVVIVCTCVFLIIFRVVIAGQENAIEETNIGEEAAMHQTNITTNSTVAGENGKIVNIEIDEINNVNLDTFTDLQLSDFAFALAYLVEVTLSLFVYYPLGVTVMFSGILACGYNIPGLGGRPYEIACREKKNAKRQKKANNGVEVNLVDDVEQIIVT